MRRAAVGLAAALALGACSGQRATPADGPGRDLGAIAPLADGGAVAEGTAGGADEAVSPREARAIARTLAKVSALRGLAAKREVPGVKLARDQLVARVKEKALREYPADALRREGQLLQLMGFAPVGFDYLGEMMKLLEAQLEGFYEPKNGTMYLAADLRGPEAQATLAHELVHALQDQSWDLRSRSTYRPGRGDETMALAALAEGDATSAMMDFILDEQGRTALDLPETLVRELMKSGVGMGDVQSVPHILQTTLVAPYIEGMDFVHGLRKKGGWAMVDRAWARPPVTTEQVLHVDKWEANEPALAVPTPTANALGAGWKKEDEDTFGELGFALTFGEWMTSDEAHGAAAGWGGDRAAVYSNGERLAHVVHLRYDAAKPEDALAAGAFSKLGAGLRHKLGAPSVQDAQTICYERATLGPLLVARTGRDLALVAGPATAGASWASAGTCAQAKAWAAEVLAQR